MWEPTEHERRLARRLASARVGADPQDNRAWLRSYDRTLVGLVFERVRGADTDPHVKELREALEWCSQELRDHGVVVPVKFEKHMGDEDLLEMVKGHGVWCWHLLRE